MRKLFVDFTVFVTAILSLLYILNLSFGIVEFIPDNTPIFGNIDEATATTLFLASLGYFGIAGDKLVNILRVIAGKPTLELSEKKPDPAEKGSEEKSP